jgi:hypothetical protein
MRLWRQHIGAEIPIFNSSVDFLSLFSKPLSISISLAISIFLVISISLHYTENKKIIQNGGKQFAVFRLFMGTSPKNCALLGGNGNTLKLETTAKLKDKISLIAMI